jgi:phosphohistidine swiveling domain-containing protein
VAREYNLPAVVSVTGAGRLLEDHMLVTVDGFKGEIVIHDNERKATR